LNPLKAVFTQIWTQITVTLDIFVAVQHYQLWPDPTGHLCFWTVDGRVNRPRPHYLFNLRSLREKK